MHAVKNGIAPTYIPDLVTPVNEISGRSHLRSATLGDFDVPRTWTKSGSRAFSVAGPVAWNNLPASEHLRTASNEHSYWSAIVSIALSCTIFELFYYLCIIMFTIGINYQLYFPRILRNIK